MSPEPDQPELLDQPDQPSLPEAFLGVSRTVHRRAVRAFAPFDVTPGQARALQVLARHGGMRMSALSEHLRIAPRSGTEVADELERRGLVQRDSDPADRRAVLVVLTAAGRELSGRLRAARIAEADAYFAVLDEQDRVELARILGVLRAADRS